MVVILVMMMMILLVRMVIMMLPLMMNMIHILNCNLLPWLWKRKRQKMWPKGVAVPMIRWFYKCHHHPQKQQSCHQQHDDHHQQHYDDDQQRRSYQPGRHGPTVPLLTLSALTLQLFILSIFNCSYWLWTTVMKNQQDNDDFDNYQTKH